MYIKKVGKKRSGHYQLYLECPIRVPKKTSSRTAFSKTVFSRQLIVRLIEPSDLTLDRSIDWQLIEQRHLARGVKLIEAANQCGSCIPPVSRVASSVSTSNVFKLPKRAVKMQSSHLIASRKCTNWVKVVCHLKIVHYQLLSRLGSSFLSQLDWNIELGNIICPRLDLNCGYLVSEVAALSTVPQPQCDHIWLNFATLANYQKSWVKYFGLS